MKTIFGCLSAWTKATVAIFLAFVIGLIIVALSNFGSLPMALAYVAGDRLLVDATSKSMGTVEAGTVQTTTFTLMNKTMRSVKILGARSSCGCTFATDIPTVIPTGESRPLKAVVDTTKLSGDFSVQLNVFTDDPQRGLINLTVRGHARPASGPPRSKLDGSNL